MRRLADHSSRTKYGGRRDHRLLLAAIGMVVGALLLVSCSSSDDTADTTVPSEDATTTTTEASSDNEKSIGVSLPFTENDAWRPLMAGAQEAADERGYRLLTSSSSLSIDDQVSELNTWVAQQVGALTLFPLDPSALGPIVDRAIAQGTKVVAYASPVEGAEGSNTFDDVQGGEAVAEAAAAYAIEHFDGKPVVALITNDICEVCRIRKEAMVNKLTELLPDMVIVAEAEGQSAAEGLEVAPPILQANPDVNMFLSHNDAPCAGISQAIRAAGNEPEDIWCGGLDGSLLWMEKLLSGDAYGATAALNLVQIGRDTVNIAANLIEGSGPTDSVQPYDILTNDTPELLQEFMAQYDE